MRIERYGSGPNIYFGLHGWSGDHRTFLPIVNGLPADASFFSTDLPGCGDSAPPKTWSIGAVAEELSTAIDAMGSPVTLVGNCSGANIAFFVSRMIPARVARLVTIDAFAFWPWYFQVFVNPLFGRYAYLSTFQNPIGRWITNLSLSTKRAENTSLTDGFSRVDHKATYRYLMMLRDGGGVTQFRDLAMPIDITYGGRSFQGVAESARIFQQMWPQATVTPLPDAGHLPLQEATAKLQQIIFSRRELAGRTEDTSCKAISTHSVS